jgi:ABC-type sugar transport system substrate-binding protein
MTLNPARRLTVSTLFAAAGATALAAAASAQKELTALLTQTQGNVTIVEIAVQQTNRALPVPRRAQDFQVMRSGDEVRLPEGASLGLV